MNFAWAAVDDEEARTVMANRGANLPGNKRVLLRSVIRYQQGGIRSVYVRHCGERIFGARAESGGEAGVVGGAVMIDIVGAERGAGEAVEQIVFFVGGVIGADHADGGGPVRIADLLEASRNFFERVFPAGGFEFAVAANERLADSFRIVREIEAEASFAAEKLAVNAGMVAIVGAEDFVVANAKRGFASVRAVRAGLGDVGHFPRARLIAISSACERADRADIDAHAAFFAS